MRASVLLQTVRTRYVFRCGYCGVSENDVGATMTVDHYRPRSEQGSNDLDNLVYCCHSCNQYKGDYWNPESDERILHPLFDNFDEHCREEPTGVLTGLTPMGIFHIAHLQLNRRNLIAYRRRQLQENQQFETLQQMDRRLAAIEVKLEIQRRGGE